jgi:hypothetical protein
MQISKIYRYKATGSFAFPFDMLRYDRCWPASGEDSALLENVHRSIKKRTVSLEGLDNPTLERWESFGWNITRKI